MPRCINHNERETIFFCVNCGNYICDECRESFEGKNFCKRCYIQPVLDYHHIKLPPKPYYGPVSSCSELIIRGIFILLGIFAIFLGLYAFLISTTGEYEVNLKRVLIIFLIGFLMIMLGIIRIKKQKKRY